MRRGMAFEVTSDDVFIVLHKAGIETTCAECESILGESLNVTQIEKAALYGADIDEQTHYAHQEIHAQLVTAGLIATSLEVEVEPKAR